MRAVITLEVLGPKDPCFVFSLVCHLDEAGCADGADVEVVAHGA